MDLGTGSRVDARGCDDGYTSRAAAVHGRLRDEPDVLVQELLRNGDRRSIVAACGAIGGVCGLILFLAAFSGAFGDPRRALFSHTLTMWTLMIAPVVVSTALGYAINGVAHAMRQRRLTSR